MGIILILFFSYQSYAAQVEISQESAVPVVYQRWSDKVKVELYGPEAGKSGSPLWKLRTFNAIEGPFSVIGVVAEKFLSDFSKQAPKIAQECKNKNAASPWRQIHCAAESVYLTLKRFGWPDSSTRCRAHAEAFAEVFKQLGIPRSMVSSFSDDNSQYPHVLNRINLTDRNGRPFAYAIDVGFPRPVIFPLTDLTEKFHESNRQRLPEISFEEPNYSFKPREKGDQKPSYTESWAELNCAGLDRVRCDSRYNEITSPVRQNEPPLDDPPIESIQGRTGAFLK